MVKKSGGPSPCRLFCLDPIEAMVKGVAPGARFEVLAGGKTFVHEEEPEAFARLALPFLVEAFEPTAPEARA